MTARVGSTGPGFHPPPLKFPVEVKAFENDPAMRITVSGRTVSIKGVASNRGTVAAVARFEVAGKKLTVNLSRGMTGQKVLAALAKKLPDGYSIQGGAAGFKVMRGGPAAPRTPASPALKVGAKPVGKDPLQVRSGALKGNTLSLEVLHGGGSKKHAYQLAWAGMFLETFPVQVGLQLSHNARGDRARAFVNQQLSFDLTPLRDAYRAAYRTQHGTIMMSVPGLDQRFAYEF